MDVVLVGLPGSGKSVVGRRLAKAHAAAFIDLDERIESAAGRTIPEIFADEGEAAFRALERAAIADLGPADPETDVRRVIATGGGAIVDPRNRWALYRGRTAVWLDGRPEVLAQRLRRSPQRPAARHRARPDRDDPRPGDKARAVLRRGGHPAVRGRRDPRRRRRDRRAAREPARRRPPAGPCSCAPRRRSDGSSWAPGSPSRR